MKQCSKCKLTFELSEFPVRSKGKLRDQCRKCYLEVVHKRKQRNRNAIATNKVCNTCNIELPPTCFTKSYGNKDGLSGKCSSCRKLKSKKYYDNNKHKINTKSKIRYEKNKEKINQRAKLYRELNASKINEARKEYRRSERAKLIRKQWEAKNPHIKLMKNLRSRHNDFFRYNIKQGLDYSTTKALGCTPQEFQEYLIANFSEGMTMENHGIVWEIDHTFPLAKVDKNNPEEIMLATHFLNLKPMYKEENMKKSDKITIDKEQHFNMIREYIKKGTGD